jgi:hypothetical protein
VGLFVERSLKQAVDSASASPYQLSNSWQATSSLWTSVFPLVNEEWLRSPFLDRTSLIAMNTHWLHRHKKHSPGLQPYYLIVEQWIFVNSPMLNFWVNTGVVTSPLLPVWPEEASDSPHLGKAEETDKASDIHALTKWFLLLLAIGVSRISWSKCSGVEKSKQNTWMGWGRKALLREGQSPILPGEGREEGKGQGLLIGHLYTTLNLEVGRQYIISWLLWPVG